MVPLVARVYAAVKNRLHVEMLSKEHSVEKKYRKGLICCRKNKIRVMNTAYSYYDTQCIMVCSLRRWYYEEPNRCNTMVCSQ